MKSKCFIVGIIIFLLCFISCKTTTVITSNKKIDIPPSHVIFTFDDGPNQHDDVTVRLLDVFGKYQIKGVFCLLGENVLNYPDIVMRIYNEGHVIVNHGFSDKFSIFMNDDEFRNNLLQAEKAISDTLGKEIYPKFYRPQGGIYNKRQQEILTEEGYIIVSFTVIVNDVFKTSKNYKRLTKRIPNVVKKQDGGIILLHDGRGAGERREKRFNRNPSGPFNRTWIPDAVEEIIIGLLDSGFILNDNFDLYNILNESGVRK